MSLHLRETYRSSQYVERNGSFEIRFQVAYPGPIRVSAFAASRENQLRLGMEPQPPAPITAQHKIELFRPSQATAVASSTSGAFPSQLLYRALTQAGDLPGQWRARLTNLDNGFEFTLTVDYMDEFYEYWLGHQDELGQPFTDRIPVSDGFTVYFQRGCVWKGPASDNQFIPCDLVPPLVAQPKLLNPAIPQERIFGLLRWRTSVEMRNKIKTRQPRLFTETWLNHLVLQQVVAPGKTAEELPLRLATRELPNGCVDVSMVAPERYQAGTTWITLKDRTLYNLSFHLPGRETVVLAPHAIYTKTSWENFGFIHATDLHLSRRLDSIRRRLEAAGKLEGAAEYNNHNNAFRELISYANHLHDIGMADFLVLTGDIIDFGFDSDDDRRANWQLGRGNWAFFERLVLGQVPSPDPMSIAYEELRLPIFLVLGNHDYRVNPYELLFDIDIQWPLSNETVRLYGGMNLIQEEAKALQSGRVPWLSQEEALKTLEIDVQNLTHSFDYFYKRIMPTSQSYVVNLGSHRLVMISTKWDLGIPEGSWDVLRAWWEGGEELEDMRQAATGSPNSYGLGTGDLSKVKAALEEAGSGGLVIVGMHAPPFNSYGEATHSHYFRETEHPTANCAEVVGFLRRATGGTHDPYPPEVVDFLCRTAGEVTSTYTYPAAVKAYLGIDPPDYSASAKERQADFHYVQLCLREWTKNGTPYFKRGGIETFLDHGVAKSCAEDFLKLCVGVGVPRRVDLILCGHNHDRAEFRLGWDASTSQFLFYTDFYTENSANYYRSRRIGYYDPVHINIEEGVPLNGGVTTVHDFRGDPFWKEALVLSVPPYPRPLNSTNNANDWWAQHRPLIIETASLGPTDSNQRKNLEINPTPPGPAFQGFRVFTVRNNTIQKSHYVALKELRERRYRMPWETEDQSILPWVVTLFGLR